MPQPLQRSLLRHLRGKEDPRGVYTLIVKVAKPHPVKFSGKGARLLREGVYCYTGSALGRGSTGLLRRISRHLSLVKKKRWHIDYLLSSRYVTVEGVVIHFTDRGEECRVNRKIESFSKASKELRGLGSSDCKSGCTAHLLNLGKIDPQIATGLVADAYRELGLNPITLGKNRTDNEFY